MILTELPDLPPRPLTTSNATFRADFFARWGKETLIMCGRTHFAEYPTVVHPLSIKMAWAGEEVYRFRRRTVRVGDGSYLVLNDGNAYGSILKSERPVTSFSMFFRAGLAGEVEAARRQSLGAALDQPDATAAAGSFSEHLRPHDDVVTPRMRRILACVEAGERDEQWLEEQSIIVLEALHFAERAASASFERLSAAKASTRIELTRRLRLAADFIQSHYGSPLALSAMAEAASMSPFHFVRYFRMLHGTTPHAYLVARRAKAARRLLAAGEADLDRVVLQSGFGSRSSLRRALARPADGSAGPWTGG